MLKTQIQYPMKTKIGYVASDGARDDAKFITLKAPTVRSLKQVGPIKQMFMQAMLNMGSSDLTEKEQETIKAAENKKKVEEEKDDELFCQMLSSSSEINYTEFLEKFSTMMKAPEIALIDGEVAVTESFLHQLPIEELETMVGKYLSNFLMPSAMKE